jgi:tetraacyldisaccharide 4'-kinase
VTVGARIQDGMAVLTPLSWVYRAGVASVRAARKAGLPAAAVPRVVSVGNLEVGGSGKTPLALWLVERAAAAGKRVAYVSRGFASAAEHGPLVTVVPAHDGTPPASLAGLRVVSRSAMGLADAAGDEAAVVAARAPAVPLVLARDKRRAVEVAGRLGAEIVVVDDAFQSFALARHVDVLLLDSLHPLANGRVLPAGRLREAPSAIGRADIVVFNGAGSSTDVDASKARVARWLCAGAKVYGLARRSSLVPATRTESGAPTSAFLVAGIAKPSEFSRSVEAIGVRVEGMVAYRDHHRYQPADVEEIRARSSGHALVTTEKDWTKLGRFDWGDTRVWIARLDVDLVGGEDVDGWLLG